MAKKLLRKIISLKMDSTTRHDRSVSGVKEKVEILALSITEICVTQTAVILK